MSENPDTSLTTEVTSWALTFKLANFTDKMVGSKNQGEIMFRSGSVGFVKMGRHIDWSLTVHPNGLYTFDRFKGFVSVMLDKRGRCDVPISTVIICSIINKQGGRSRTRRLEHTFEEDVDGEEPGFTRFISHTGLAISKDTLLPNDTLTIHCEIFITGVDLDTSSSSSGASMSSLSVDIGSIFETRKLTDCTVSCDGREYRCHKNILSGRSPVFDAMFTSDFKENKESKVEIMDLDGDTVYNMIIFIYSGKVTELKEKAAGLLAAAEKYDLKELKTMCEASLADNVNKDNVVDVLVLADLHGSNMMRERGLEFILDNGKDVMTEPGWWVTLKAHPRIMAEMLEAFNNFK